jgi:hypothetical protein
MMIVFFFGFYLIIRATQLPHPPHLHSSRAYLSAVLVVSSLVFPMIAGGFVAAGASMMEHPLYRKNQVYRQTTIHKDFERYKEMDAALKAVREEILAIWRVGQKNNVSREQENAFKAVYEKVNKMIEEKSRRISDRVSEMGHAGVPGVGVSAGSIGLFAFPSLFFAIAGTVLGIGYVSRIRREKERPGLGAALFAALFFPVVIVLGVTTFLIAVGGFVGFLIILAVAGILVGVYYGVRWWLAN